MEYWNIGLKKKYSFTLFHHSNIPIIHLGLHPIQKRAKVLFALF
jgi:hypothetical protein